jgi:hypothetical protein
MEEPAEYIVSGDDAKQRADRVAKAVHKIVYGHFVAGRKFSCEIHSPEKNETVVIKTTTYVEVR